GHYELATIDEANARVQRVQTFAGADSINPQWSRDGRQLYFISSRNGIPEVYAVSIANGATAQLTNVATGTSGITASSPALSVAGMRDLAAFSVYNDGKYDIYTIDAASSRGALARQIEN